MRIVVCGGRKYGKIPDWVWGKPVLFTGESFTIDGVRYNVEYENPVYIDACRRAGSERRRLYDVLDSWYRKYGQDLKIATGGAPGADILALRWAHEKKLKSVTFIAEWSRLGRAAGPIRNRRMLDEFKPDLVIAFPGGTGTEGLVNEAKARKIPVVRVR